MKFRENDTVVVYGNKFATVLHAYDDDNMCEIEIKYYNGNVVKTVSNDELLLVTTR
jgi:hypothetical protein